MWHTLLLEQIPMSPAVADKLSRQLVSQARTLAQVALDDNRHALVPPDHGFIVQYRSIDGTTIASVDGYLIGPDTWGYSAVLAWRSIAGSDPRLTPERNADDLEFFWQEFPAEIAHPTRIETGDRFARNRLRFDVDAELYRLTGVQLQFTTRTEFTPEGVAGIVAAMANAIVEWNASRPSLVHYCSEPEVVDDGRTIAMYIDLGSGGLDALAEILDAVSAAPVGADVDRCRVR